MFKYTIENKILLKGKMVIMRREIEGSDVHLSDFSWRIVAGPPAYWYVHLTWVDPCSSPHM